MSAQMQMAREPPKPRATQLGPGSPVLLAAPAVLEFTAFPLRHSPQRARRDDSQDSVGIGTEHRPCELFMLHLLLLNVLFASAQ